MSAQMAPEMLRLLRLSAAAERPTTQTPKPRKPQFPGNFRRTSDVEEFRGSADADVGGSKLLREVTMRGGSLRPAVYPIPGSPAGERAVDSVWNRGIGGS